MKFDEIFSLVSMRAIDIGYISYLFLSRIPFDDDFPIRIFQLELDISPPKSMSIKNAFEAGTADLGERMRVGNLRNLRHFIVVYSGL